MHMGNSVVAMALTTIIPLLTRADGAKYRNFPLVDTTSAMCATILGIFYNVSIAEVIGIPIIATVTTAPMLVITKHTGNTFTRITITNTATVGIAMRHVESMDGRIITIFGGFGERTAAYGGIAIIIPDAGKTAAVY